MVAVFLYVLVYSTGMPLVAFLDILMDIGLHRSLLFIFPLVSYLRLRLHFDRDRRHNRETEPLLDRKRELR